MANSDKPEAASDIHLEGSRVVPADYGMPGSKGMESPWKPLVWLLLPFFFCLGYGLLTR